MKHITVILDTGSLELDRESGLPGFIESVTLEVGYEFVKGEKSSGYYNGDLDKVEIMTTNVLTCYLSDGIEFIPTDIQSDRIINLLDTDDIETAVLENLDA